VTVGGGSPGSSPPAISLAAVEAHRVPRDVPLDPRHLTAIEAAVDRDLRGRGDGVGDHALVGEVRPLGDLRLPAAHEVHRQGDSGVGPSERGLAGDPGRSVLAQATRSP